MCRAFGVGLAVVLGFTSSYYRAFVAAQSADMGAVLPHARQWNWPTSKQQLVSLYVLKETPNGKVELAEAS